MAEDRLDSLKECIGVWDDDCLVSWACEEIKRLRAAMDYLARRAPVVIGRRDSGGERDPQYWIGWGPNDNRRRVFGATVLAVVEAAVEAEGGGDG